MIPCISNHGATENYVNDVSFVSQMANGRNAARYVGVGIRRYRCSSILDTNDNDIYCQTYCKIGLAKSHKI